MLGEWSFCTACVYTDANGTVCLCCIYLDDSSMSIAEQVSHETSQAISHCKSFCM